MGLYSITIIGTNRKLLKIDQISLETIQDP